MKSVIVILFVLTPVYCIAQFQSGNTTPQLKHIAKETPFSCTTITGSKWLIEYDSVDMQITATGEQSYWRIIYSIDGSVGIVDKFNNHKNIPLTDVALTTAKIVYNGMCACASVANEDYSRIAAYLSGGIERVKDEGVFLVKPKSIETGKMIFTWQKWQKGNDIIKGFWKPNTDRGSTYHVEISRTNLTVFKDGVATPFTVMDFDISQVYIVLGKI